MYYGYARVSTKEQSDNSIEEQLKFLREDATRKGEPFEVYYEKESGKNNVGRKDLQELVSVLQPGDYVGFFNNSRFGRNTLEDLTLLERITREKKARLFIAGNEVDPDNPDHIFMFTVNQAVATKSREEQNKLSKQLADVLREKGYLRYRGDLYGYNLKRRGKKAIAEIIEEEAEVIREIFERYAAGASYNEIANNLNARGIRKPKKERKGKSISSGVFTADTVLRIINRPIYAGKYPRVGPGRNNRMTLRELDLNDLITSKIYEPIISEELWNNVIHSYRYLQRSHAQQFEHRGSRYTLSSIMRCGCCGAGYVHSFKKRYNKSNPGGFSVEWYICNTHSPECDRKYSSLHLETFDNLFFSIFLMSFYFPDELRMAVDEQVQKLQEDKQKIERELKHIDTRIKQLEVKRDNFIDAIGDGVAVTSIKSKIQKIDAELAQFKGSRSTMRTGLSVSEEEYFRIIQDFSDDNITRYVEGTDMQRRDLLFQFLKSVSVFKDKIVVEYVSGMKAVIRISKRTGRSVPKDHSFDIFRKRKIDGIEDEYEDVYFGTFYQREKRIPEIIEVATTCSWDEYKKLTVKKRVNELFGPVFYNGISENRARFNQTT